MAKDKKALYKILKRIPIFNGLSSSQIQHVLDVCNTVTHKENEVIYAAETPSDEMHILVSGELRVISKDGIRLARLYPVTTVGEMGLVTRQTRSASVEVGKLSHLLVIQRAAFDLLFRQDTDLQMRFYQNVISILSGKIVGDNVRVRDHLLEKIEHQRKVRAERRRAETIMKILLDQTSMSEDEAVSLVDEHLVPDRMRILIVDDEQPVRTFIKEALSDYDVDEASDGIEAMKAVEVNPPDLVITDIRMPNMDGTALLKAVRNIAPNMPVLALSGYVDPEDVAEFDFDGFVKKPFELAEFRTIMDQTVSKQ